MKKFPTQFVWICGFAPSESMTETIAVSTPISSLVGCQKTVPATANCVCAGPSLPWHVRHGWPARWNSPVGTFGSSGPSEETA